jgi:hypothetical protein
MFFVTNAHAHTYTQAHTYKQQVHMHSIEIDTEHVQRQARTYSRILALDSAVNEPARLRPEFRTAYMQPVKQGAEVLKAHEKRPVMRFLSVHLCALTLHCVYMYVCMCLSMCVRLRLHVLVCKHAFVLASMHKMLCAHKSYGYENYARTHTLHTYIPPCLQARIAHRCFTHISDVLPPYLTGGTHNSQVLHCLELGDHLPFHSAAPPHAESKTWVNWRLAQHGGVHA